MRRVKMSENRTAVCRWCKAPRVWRYGAGFVYYACEAHRAELANLEVELRGSGMSTADSMTWGAL